jgi:hypothetical protein
LGRGGAGAGPRIRHRPSVLAVRLREAHPDAEVVGEKVIYFPRINPPDNEWFTRVLLYWDKVATIVPMEGRDRVLSWHARRLIDAGLVRPIVPFRHVGSIPRFSQAFLDLIESDETVRTRRSADLARVPLTVIHMQKFGENLAEELIVSGLARRPRDPELAEWLEVEERTGHLFMTYLATALGHLKTLNMAPITDTENYLSLLLPPAPEVCPAAKAALKVAVLSRALPAPAGGVAPEEIADFKREYAQLLVRFRVAVTQKALEATRAAPGARIELAEAHGAELGQMAEEIAASMERRRWRGIGRGALAVLGAVFATADAVFSGSALSQASAGADLAAAAWGAIDPENVAPVRSDAVAYAAVAAREIGRS